MKPFKLISCTDFVLEQTRKDININKDGLVQLAEVVVRVENYAKFLNQTLGLEMFIPCKYSMRLREPEEDEIPLVREYQQAKERVLFNLNNVSIALIEKHIYERETIESLVGKYKITLTKTAIKQLEHKKK